MIQLLTKLWHKLKSHPGMVLASGTFALAGVLAISFSVVDTAKPNPTPSPSSAPTHVPTPPPTIYPTAPPTYWTPTPTGAPSIPPTPPVSTPCCDQTPAPVEPS